MRPTSYIATLLLGFAGTIAAAAAFNYAVDADGVYMSAATRMNFARSYVRRLSTTAEGLVFVPQERSIKIQLAHETRADCIVQGSSHEMELAIDTAPRLFQGCAAVTNLAVSGAAIEDFIATAAVLKQRRFNGVLYVGIQPWLFHRRADTRFQEIGAAYLEGRSRLGLTSDAISVREKASWLSNLISSEYLSHNAKSLLTLGAGGYVRIVPAQAASIEDKILRSDGSFLYSPREQQTPPRPLVPGGGNYKMEGPVLDPAVTAEFEQTLRALRSDGARIAFVLMPYNPSVFACPDPAICARLGAVETYARRIAAAQAIPVFGSFDPRRLGLGWRDFMDDMHLRREALSQIVSAR